MARSKKSLDTRNKRCQFPRQKGRGRIAHLYLLYTTKPIINQIPVFLDSVNQM